MPDETELTLDVTDVLAELWDAISAAVADAVQKSAELHARLDSIETKTRIEIDALAAKEMIAQLLGPDGKVLKELPFGFNKPLKIKLIK